jgi:adenylate cyclase
MRLVRLQLGDLSAFQKAEIGSPIMEAERRAMGLSLSSTRSTTIPQPIKELARFNGVQLDFSKPLGLHPDFVSLKGTDQVENHWIVSLFVDIKGSTNLYKKYSANKVHRISATILNAAIHTFSAFGGYVHRIQGDGLFVYFGGRSISRELAVQEALRSSSVFSHFVKNDLSLLLERLSVTPVKVRIGIDFGDDKEVLWISSGIDMVSEVTTVSLHTSLASKMQANAAANGVVIGRNVILRAQRLEEFVSAVSARTGIEEDRYVFRSDSLNYGQYDFDWPRFMKDEKMFPTALKNIIGIETNKISSSGTDPMDLAARLRVMGGTKSPYFS